MKRLLLLLLVFVFLLSFASAQCVEGIDDVCDPNCIEVDFDCAENSAGAEQDFVCNTAQDGICDTRCYEVDYDCIFKQQEDIKTPTNIPTSQAESQSFTARFSDSSPSTLELILFGVGFFLFAIGVLWALRHLEEKRERPQYHSLIPYGQSALEQGYSHSQIKSSLKSQGYSPKFIKGYMKALEHRP